MASDKCNDTAATMKYTPVAAVCPMIKPLDLNIEVLGGDVIAVNANITFHLTQEEVVALNLNILF